jgi:hypothetical protein
MGVKLVIVTSYARRTASSGLKTRKALKIKHKRKASNIDSHLYTQLVGLILQTLTDWTGKLYSFIDCLN